MHMTEWEMLEFQELLCRKRGEKIKVVFGAHGKIVSKQSILKF